MKTDLKEKSESLVSNEPVQPETQPLTPDQEKQKQMQQLYDQLFKQVQVGVIADAIRAQITEILTLIESLKEEINLKRNGVLEKKALMQEKLAALRSSGKVNVNDNEFTKFHHGVDEYLKLLDTMLKEVDQDITFYQAYLSPTPPATITIERFGPDDFSVIMQNRFKMVRKNVKNAKRDLAISFSRYCYGFDSQMRQILYVESIVKNMK